MLADLLRIPNHKNTHTLGSTHGYTHLSGSLEFGVIFTWSVRETDRRGCYGRRSKRKPDPWSTERQTRSTHEHGVWHGTRRDVNVTQLSCLINIPCAVCVAERFRRGERSDTQSSEETLRARRLLQNCEACVRWVNASLCGESFVCVRAGNCTTYEWGGEGEVAARQRQSPNAHHHHRGLMMMHEKITKHAVWQQCIWWKIITHDS